MTNTDSAYRECKNTDAKEGERKKGLHLSAKDEGTERKGASLPN